MRILNFLLVLTVFSVAQMIPVEPQIAGPNQQRDGDSLHPQLKNSDVILGFEWVGEQTAYPPPEPRGDTFPMTWADDNNIYASAGDPSWGGKPDGLDIEMFSGAPPRYTVTRVNPMADYKGYGGSGQKPSGMICVKGVLYLAFQNLLGKKPPAYGTKSQHGSDAMIVSSRDHGKTWTPAFKDITEPMFPGNFFGGPAFVNTGRNNAHAPDRYVYALSTDQWDNGSHLRVGRVLADRIQDASAWEWIAELKGDNHPGWTNNLQQAVPVFTDDRRISLPDMVYIAPIKRYVLLTWRLYKDFSPHDGTELMIYDAPPVGTFHPCSSRGHVGIRGHESVLPSPSAEVAAQDVRRFGGMDTVLG
jgi:hypothetical protein